MSENLADTRPRFLREGWAYRRTFSPVRERIAIARSATARSENWGGYATDIPMDEPRLLRAILRAIEFASPKVVISVSHDHYVKIAGGLQNCVRSEQTAFTDSGWVYVHICPAWPKLHLADPDAKSSSLALLTVNGQRIGVVELDTLQGVLATIAPTCDSAVAIVHQLLGFAPETILTLIEALQASVRLFWVHDLFSLCPSVNLLRNDAKFCFNPPASSSACSVCCYGSERHEHLTRFRNFFESLDPIVVAPSTTIANFWVSGQTFKFRDVKVIPPAKVEFANTTRPRDSRTGPIKVAFLGQPAYHKGWPAFEDLARWFEGQASYEFHILGDSDPGVPNLKHTPVTVTLDDRTRMADAVRDLEIDIVVNWSMCYESFSFTAIEALAGGAFVIARKDAGNVWPLVASIDPNRGCVVADDDELMALFVSGEVSALLNQTDARVGRLTFSNGSFELVREVVNA